MEVSFQGNRNNSYADLSFPKGAFIIYGRLFYNFLIIISFDINQSSNYLIKLELNINFFS